MLDVEQDSFVHTVQGLHVPTFIDTTKKQVTTFIRRIRAFYGNTCKLALSIAPRVQSTLG